MKETFGSTCHGAVSIEIISILYHLYQSNFSLINNFTQILYLYKVMIYVPLYIKRIYIQGRALSRAKSRRNLDYMQVLEKLEELGISIRVASPKLVMEEAPESYKNVTDVVNTCHTAGISKKCIKLRPIAVIKG